MQNCAGALSSALRRFVVTTQADPQSERAVDLVDRKFYTEGPDRLWVADITYIPTWSGFLYLAMVLDVYSRRIVGWAMETHLKTELILAALNMAITQRRPTAVIHHSDRGCQPGLNWSSQHCLGVRISVRFPFFTFLQSSTQCSLTRMRQKAEFDSEWGATGRAMRPPVQRA